MDRLQAMQNYVRVVETGSFSAVARELSSTQSAVSKQIAALEKYLGVRLLSRTTRALTPTDDGLRYFEEARRLVGEIVESLRVDEPLGIVPACQPDPIFRLRHLDMIDRPNHGGCEPGRIAGRVEQPIENFDL